MSHNIRRLGVLELTTQFPVAVYAATISTAALAWSIISTRAARRMRLRVTLHYGMRIPADHNGNQVGPRLATLKLCIVNSGAIVQRIECPGFELSRKVAGNKYADKTELNESFPVKLEPGETFEKTFFIPELESELFRHMRPNDTIRGVVRNTLGKAYRSPKLKISSIRSVAHSVARYDPFQKGGSSVRPRVQGEMDLT